MFSLFDTKFCYVSLFILLMLSKPLLAESGWTSNTRALELTATTAGKFIIHATPKHNPSNCKDKEKFYLNYGLPGTKRIYDLLLQATVSRLPIKLHVTGRCELFGMSEISKASITFSQKP